MRLMTILKSMGNDKMKKVLLVTFVLIFALNGLCFAAKSSSSPPARSSSSSGPSTNSPASQAAPGGYKPSAPANSYNNQAPAAKPNQAAAATQTPQPAAGSNWMRNIGMLAGGMMLGGMLSSMLGHGSTGLLADIMGIIISVIPIILLFVLGRFLWTRYKNRQENVPAR
jgi:predicted lipid-binding transport protein (Tim44 family)